MPSEDSNNKQTPSTESVILFDGVCNLCNGFVNWIIDRDPDTRFRFLPLQSNAGRAIVAEAGLKPEILGTLVVIDSGRIMLRSSGVLWIGSRLETRLAGLARAIKFVPTPLRDIVYRLVAWSRYRIFGRTQACRVPTPELMHRFLDPDDVDASFRAAGLEKV
jgi:predicted DCC family thiol-disulfide oxidoreductase YuxK